MANNIYGVSQVSEITPFLYLTSVYGATKENILKKGITLLVNSAQELPKQDISGVESIKLFLDDTPYALINVYFDRIADKIHEHASRGGRCMVHCVLGVSRSTSLVLAYLMKYKNMSLKNAYDFVASRRPCIRPNPGFWRQLLDYEKRLITSSYSTSTNTNTSTNSSNERTVTFNTGKNETSIPITIVSSSSSNGGSSQLIAPRSTSSVTTNFSSYIPNYSSNIPTYHNNSDSPYLTRPYSGSRYGSSSYLGKSNDYPTISKSTSSFSKLYKSNSSNNNIKPSTNRLDVYYDSYGNGSSLINNTNGLSIVANNPPSPHRTSLIINDESSRYSNKPNTFSTTYRSSYGRY